MPYYDIFREFDPNAVAHESLLARSEQIQSIKKNRRFEIIVVGGGIHGATLARLAAFNGLRTLLLEKNDYGSATSSRSSKMAHGGLRYLELLDFKQVKEGIRARENLYLSASHLVHPYPFRVPIKMRQRFFKFKLGIGLWLYDYFTGPAAVRHSWIKASDINNLSNTPYKGDLSGVFEYSDGIMNDYRLVLENIYSARREGAFCLNYSAVVGIKKRIGAICTVTWKDLPSGEQIDCEAGVVVNCAGPWVPDVAALAGVSLANQIAFSRGTHLVFKKPWKGPALCIPLKEKSRYYFVWPHPAGTMVGTTEREIQKIDEDPVASKGEVEELLAHIERDLPDAGLSHSNLHYTFAGVRTLALRKGGVSQVEGSSTPRISRRHVWHYENGLLSLLGGKFTTAVWTAEEGLKLIYSLAGLRSKMTSLATRKFFGASDFENEGKLFTEEGFKRGLSAEMICGLIGRHGSRVRMFREADPEMKTIGGVILESEVSWACDQEQSEDFTDIARRLELVNLDDHGLSALPMLVQFLQKLRSEIDWNLGAQRYVSRLEEGKSRL